MRCPRCQAELPDSATTCTQCGAAVRQSAIQPFSYLPAGAPPWPTTIPQRPGASASTLTLETSTAASTSSARPKRSVKSVLAIVGVLVLIPLLGSAFTFLVLAATLPPASTANVQVPGTVVIPQATPTTQLAQLPTPTSFKDVSNPDVNVSLQYPSDWQVEPANKSQTSTQVDIHPQQQIPLDFIVVHFTDSTSTQIPSPDSLNQSQIESFNNPQQGITDAKADPSTSKQQTIAGTTWTQVEGNFTINNTKAHILSAAVQHNKSYYSIIFIAPTAIYQEAMDKYAKHMLSTFKFLA